MDKDMAEIYANTYFYGCCECEQLGFSRDEVSEVKKVDGTINYICDHCIESIPYFRKED